MESTTKGATSVGGFMTSGVDRYHGLLKKSFIEQLIQSMSEFFAYAYNVCNNFDALHSVVRYWRLWCLISPALCAAFPIWVKGTFAQEVVNIITVPAFWVPVGFRNHNIHFFLVIYIILEFLFALLISICSMYLTKKGQTPMWIPNTILILGSSLMLIINCPSGNLLGEFIGQLIVGQNELSIGASVILIIVTILVYAVYFLIYKNLISMTITFRPISFMTVFFILQLLIFCVPTLISFLLGIAAYLGTIPRCVLMIISVLSYCTLYASSFFFGGYVNTYEESLFNTFSLTSAVILLILMIQDLAGSIGNETELAAFVVLFILVFFIVKFISVSYRKRIVFILDEFVDDDTTIHNIKSVNKFINCVAIGFSYAHPACINWSFCQAGVEKWPDSFNVWYIFLKFVTIYPDQSFVLNSICRSIILHEFSGTFMKNTLTEVGQILKMRENNLSPALKQRLNSINRNVNSTKHKLRNIWDFVIQGNVVEMEKAVTNTYNSMLKTNSMFNHILRQYPNNRFITRAYSRFLIEVCADTKGFAKYEADTKLLHRGLLANEDKAHELGVKSYPFIPDSLSKEQPATNLLSATSEETNTDLGSEETISNEQTNTLENIIDNIQFPKLQRAIYARWIMYFFVWLLFMVILIVFCILGTNQIDDPLIFIRYFGRLAEFSFTLPAFAQKYVLEKIGLITPTTTPGPGGYTNLGDQLLYLANDASTTISNMASFNTFRVGDKEFDEARSYVYEIDYPYFLVGYDMTHEVKQMTAISQLTDFILESADLVKNIDSIVNNDNQYIRTMSMNSQTIVDSMNEACHQIEEYITSTQQKVVFVIIILLICLCVVQAIIWIAVGIFIVRKATEEKDVIYKSLTTLPKNVISQVIDKLKLIKKAGISSTQNSETDINKQEDNIIKIFATAGESNNANESFKLINYLTMGIGCVLFIASAVTYALLMRQKALKLKNSAPHIRYMIFSYAYQVGVSSIILTLKGEENVPDFNAARTVSELQFRMARAALYFNFIRYGNISLSIEPFEEFNEIISADQEGSLMTPEISFMLETVFFNTISVPYSNGDKPVIPQLSIETIWGVNSQLFNGFFNPLTLEIIERIQETCQKMVIPGGVFIAIVLILLFFQELYVTHVNLLLQKRLRFTLKLLMHCPVQAVQQSIRIMTVLSGNFDPQKVETAAKNTDYYLDIINNMPDGVIITEEGLITFMNSAAIRIFGDHSSEGIKITDLVKNQHGESADDLKEGVYMNAIHKTADGESLNLQLTAYTRSKEKIFTIKDNTQSVRYNQLIAEERQRSDMMLSSILPAKLVPRVQAGETDISFEVPTATVLFMDIVEFTPWCASLEADQVMLTLNTLYTAYDNLVNNTTTMTRIKCIGDCYMAAGGIFAEVNQPDVHARECVKFGLDSISAVQQVNQLMNQNLRIRVGINTGGPLVAGVIGTGKPTFEIIGPVINMAQQMEHCGVPMKVHISRSVYELIYGSSQFQIKERGQIEIKNGTAITYLVSES